ncbi:helix-turn-helix transcriptional regulator [Tenggerimyces flavus]|uniref:Helix-turn-helix transcriptional regulator n=1 Tax=Tenggerimyces flavus TaxID=1708749 RepID=A0ABV7YRL7_9ACTN|nr:hypothetical protein [Tenggerimyces flavus]MBM7790201.1 hypothetical protein [Tenggerimyces flavus]
MPDLPFVDDSHLPLNDRFAIEAIGRHGGGETWGREDLVRRGDDGWVAFTTDADRHDLAWCVRWHPEYGRTVELYRDDDAAGMHMALQEALMYRSGGYWWNGEQWYRPSQIWDGTREIYLERPVPGATNVTAADLLAGRTAAGAADASSGHVLQVAEVSLDKPYTGRRWLDDLALWAARRAEQERTDELPPLSACVVKLAAPELTADQLIGLAEIADLAGVKASTLRSYASRGEGELPQAQAVINGHNVWSRAVAEEWVEARNRSSDALTSALSTPDPSGHSRPAGITELWRQYSSRFFSLLWDRPDARKRWALRWRNQAAALKLADNLGWVVASGLDNIVPMTNLGITIRHALLDELATGQELDRDTAGGSLPFYGIVNPVARMLDWLIRHDPALAAHVITETIGEARRRLQIAPPVTERSIRVALSLTGKLDDSALNDYLTRVFMPAESSSDSSSHSQPGVGE